MTDFPRRVDIAIVGGGIAGASVAWELSRRGAGSIALLEKEPLPGTHASGRNAALILQDDTDDVNGRIAQHGARFYADPPDDFTPRPEFRRNGSLLLGSGDDAGELICDHMEAAERRGLAVERWTAAQAARRVPILNPARFTGGVFCPSDGIIDIHAALHAFLNGALARGVSVRFGCAALHAEVEGGRVTGLATSEGRLDCGMIVNAAGAWAGPLADASGVPLGPALRPTRRHLFVTQPSPLIDPGWPFVWDMGRPFYFRPESGGLLMCACDIVDAPDAVESVDPRTLEKAAARAAALIPPVTGLGVAHAWSGIRTLTPDDRFVIGADPRLPGFFWVAGLGGHGMVGAPAASRIAADLIERGATDLVDPKSVAPERFLGR